MIRIKIAAVVIASGFGLLAGAFVLAAGNSAAQSANPEAVASVYVADFIATAAFGVGMNDAGDVIGTSYPDPGCGPFCLPTLETVVWRSGVRTVLPAVPGFTGITLTGINNLGWISGFAGLLGTTTHAVVWQPSGTSYIATDLMTLPNTTISYAIGIDDQQRAVGWSSSSFFPPVTAPFVWSPTTGLLDLTVQGFPNDVPLAISPGGTVATPSFWYQLGNPASLQAMTAPPAGFYPPGTHSTRINDAGDQGRFLVSTSSQSLVYPFRFNHAGTWQQISFSGTGSLSNYGMGGINDFSDITATVLSTGMIAAGPAGLLQPVAPLLSPAYQGATLTQASTMNRSGQILGQVLIGSSARLMRLTPATPCSGNCGKISKIQMTGKFVQDPSDPGHCSPDLNAYNKVQAKLTVTDENGVALSGAAVSGRFLDNYWTDKKVSGRTDSRGQVKFSNKGPCGVGTVTFFVDNVVLGTRSFDRTSGVLTGSVIPK
jgi:hypothetical protein